MKLAPSVRHSLRLTTVAALALAAAVTACSDPPGLAPDAAEVDAARPDAAMLDAGPDGPTGPMATITVERTGTGSGGVRSSPPGIDCGASCSASFPVGSLVALLPTAASDSGFTGWSGPCTGTGACTFTLTADTTVTAEFDLATYPVTIVRSGNGVGSVTSTPAGLDCPGTCTFTFAHGTEVTIAPNPGASTSFLGWAGGGCTGTAPCTFTVTEARTVNAAFALDQTLVVTRTGFGAGTVTSTPAGIDCGADCDEVYPGNTVVTLTAAADPTSTFAGWSGGGCAGVGPCTVNVANAVAVDAQFDRRQYPVLVERAGNGTGVVTSLPSGINCGADCMQAYAAGTIVTLTATPTGQSSFTGWTGSCTGMAPCTLTIDSAKSATATFTINSYPLTVTLGGTGSGTVVSSPAGIDCGADCTENFPATSLVSLQATPAPGSTFAGWSGGGCIGNGPCVVTMSSTTTVTANFVSAPTTLIVARAGGGSGTITSSPGGINCGTDCVQDYPGGTMVTLTATPTGGDLFAGWAGGGCTGTAPTCVVTMTTAQTVTATFDRNTYTLSTVIAGAGGGRVTSAPGGIDCGSDCTEAFPSGTAIILTPIASPGSSFASWTGGGCTGTGTCTITLASDTNVTATFSTQRFNLNVVRAGTGAGTVTSLPTGINCGTDCAEAYDAGATVTLTAAPNLTSTFTGWTGGGCTGTGQCTVTMAAAQTVTATFTANDYPLTVAFNLAGTGTGTVASNPVGIDCGTTCTASFPAGSVVQFVPTAGPNSVFAGWSGACTGTGACNVTVSAAATITARFNLVTVPLTVNKAGNGTGTVTSTPTGISCGTTCATQTASYNHGQAVILNAAPAANATFTGWSGGGCTGTGPCTTTVTAATAVTATFTLNTYTVTIVKGGNSTGTVSSAPAGIDCGTDCDEAYLATTSVTLTAVPGPNTVFTSWSGGGCSGAVPTCTITVGANATITANFNLATYALTLTKAGNGTGTVTSAPTGISCNTSCATATGTYAHGTAVTLTANPASNASFVGWSGGGCTGTAPCTTTVTAATAVTATFTLNTYTLTVTKTGNNTATSTVSSAPAGIDCGTDCDEPYLATTPVVLTATPGPNVTFAGWSGGGCSGTGACTVTVNAATAVSAQFNTTRYNLTLTKAGNGTGTVTSAPTGVSCNAACATQTVAFDHGTAVTLTAAPAANASFVGWSGGGCTGTGPCTVTMTAATAVTATFTLNSYPLTVVRAGTGTGTVTSNPPGIDCNIDCDETYLATTPVVLTATVGPNSVFAGWSGGCTGTGTCAITINAAATVTATFNLATRALTLTKAGTGTGTVTSTPSGISCNTTCLTATGSFAHGTVVTLTAAPAATSVFTGWSGACTGTDPCVVTMDAAKAVTATFNLNTFPVTVALLGTGTGSVTSSAPGISCPGDCSENYTAGTAVTFTPTAGPNSVFASWSGGCTGTGACTVTVAAAATVNATFNLVRHNLTVAKTGAGAGTISSTPAGISCGATCSALFDYNTTVTLTAAPTATSTFTGWAGACTGTGPCTVTMTAAASVTANFALNTYLLTVARNGTSTGGVSSNPAGIDCGPGTDCTETYAGGTVVTLTATPDLGAVFGGWSGGGCTGTVPTCNTTVSAATTVTATFNLSVHRLSVVKDGTGAGTVTSVPSGVNCGATCFRDTNYGTAVTLNPAPAVGSTFTGWSAPECPGTGACTVTVTAARTINATFTLNTYALNVTKSGAGTGTVTSSVGGLTCGAVCSALFGHGTVVTLTATPDVGSTFTGWTGNCTGAATTCVVTMDAVKNVNAAF